MVVGKKQLDVGRTVEAERRINLVEDGVLVGNAGAVSRPKAARYACGEQAARQPTQRRPARRGQPQSTLHSSILDPCWFSTSLSVQKVGLGPKGANWRVRGRAPFALPRADWDTSGR